MSEGREFARLENRIRFCYRGDPWNRAWYLNQVLESEFKIQESLNYYKIFNAYRNWLIDRYFDPCFSFSSICNSKIKYRKSIQAKYENGGYVDHIYFLAKTLECFLLKHRKTYCYIFEDDYDFADTYKIYISVLKIINICDYNIDDVEDHIKKVALEKINEEKRSKANERRT